MKTINNISKLSLLIAACTIIYGCNSGGNVLHANQNNVLNNKVHKPQMKLSQSYLDRPFGIVTDSIGNIYVAMARKNLIQKISVNSAGNSVISTIAGNGVVGKPTNGGVATSQSLNLVATKSVHHNLSESGEKSSYGSVAVDSAGNIYIADSGNNLIEKVDHSTGLIKIIAGGGASSPTNGLQATSVSLSDPTGVAVDVNNNLYIADNGNLLVEEVDLTTGVLKIIAGSGNNTPSTTAQPSDSVTIMPYGIATAKNSNVYITDQMNNFVEKINIKSNTLVVMAGNGSEGKPVTGVATNSPLGSGIDGLSVDAQNNIYVADSSNNEIEKIDSAGDLSVVVGNGQNGFPYSANPATTNLYKPHGVSVDQNGTVYIADTYNQIIEKYVPSTKDFYINNGTGFIQLVGAFQCVNDLVSGNKCGCLYDPQNGETWYAGIKSGYLADWQNNGNEINHFNSKGHCGLNNWHIPSIETPSWSGSPYSISAIPITASSPEGSLVDLVRAAYTKDDKGAFRLLNNGFYTDYHALIPDQNVYWLANSSGLYSYNTQKFSWALLNYDSNDDASMYAEPQMVMNNGNVISGKVLLVSN